MSENATANTPTSPAFLRGDDNAMGPPLTYFICSLLSMLLLSGMFGSRLHIITNRETRRKIKLVRIIPYLLYATGVGFDIVAAMAVINITGPRTVTSCRIAMEGCLIFFVMLKSFVQLFLIERSHAIRARLKRRTEDSIWLVSIILCSIGTGILAIAALIAPLAQSFPTSGECRIGLPRLTTMALMIYDLTINICLTGVFLALLRPAFQLRDPKRAENFVRKMGSDASLLPWTFVRAQSSLSSLISLKLPQERIQDTRIQEDPPFPYPSVVVADPNAGALQRLVRKTIIGALAMMVGTSANLLGLYATSGEHGWVCFLCCMADITWSVTVIHFMTVDRRKDRVDLDIQDPRHMSLHQRSTRSDSISLTV